MKDWTDLDEKSIAWKAPPDAPGEPDATLFRLRARLVSRGSTEEPLCVGDDLWLKIKVYAEGGENKVHAHPNQDHAFIVLHGRARFFDSAGAWRELGVNEGIMLPAGRHYKFGSVGDEPLVVLRAGAVKAGENVDLRAEEGGPAVPRRTRGQVFISDDVEYRDDYYE
jgi:mannose-6-phosphate isomerase-like protein (cupin superfamily)